MKFTRAARGLLVGFILLSLLGWAVSGSVIYMRLAYLGIFLVAGNALWAWFSISGIRLKRETRLLRASVGDIIEERFEITNTSWRPCIWLEVKNQSPLTAGSRLITNVGPHQKRFYAVRHLLSERGAFPLGPTSLVSGDLFGLFSRHQLIPAEKTLVVLPMLFGITDFSLPVGLLPGGKSVHQKAADVTPHAAGLRDYVPSDPLKRIHWPSTAKRGHFMVKEFDQDTQSEIWIFLDAQREVRMKQSRQKVAFVEDNWWLQRRVKITLPEDTFEYAVSIAASLARYFLQQRRLVGLACSTGRYTVVQPERGERQIGKIMETLALVQADGDLPFWGLIAMQSRLLPLGSAIILITPTIRSEVLVAVEHIQQRSLRPVAVLINTRTFGGPDGTEALADGLLKRGLPVCKIGCGDDITKDLTLPSSFFHHPFTSSSHSFATV